MIWVNGRDADIEIGHTGLGVVFVCLQR